jgi:hypothetical protein
MAEAAQDAAGGDDGGVAPLDASDASRDADAVVESTGPCVPRKGIYDAVTTYGPSTCNDAGTVRATVTIDETSDAGRPPQCMGGTTVSADGCVRVHDYVDCRASGNTATKGYIRWSADGSSGHGSIAVTEYEPDGGVKCSFTYEISYSRVDGG